MQARSILFFTCAALVSFFPVIVVLISGIWIPTAMVQETFTTNFMALRLMLDQSSIFIPVGHAQLLLFSYPSALINHALFKHLPLFDQFQTFGLIWHVWSGAFIFALLMIGREFKLLMVPLFPILLLNSSNLGVMISYDRAEVLVVLGLLVVTNPAWRGSIAAFAIGTKLTFGLLILPFAFRKDWRFTKGFVATAAVGTWLYFLGNFPAMRNFYIQFKGFMKSGVAQLETTIIEAFQTFPSWYTWLELTLFASAAVFLTRHRWKALFATVLEATFLYKRLSFSAMFDVTALAALFVQLSRAWVVAAVILVFAAFTYDFGKFTTMRKNSETARALQAAIPKDRPVVYYHRDYDQALIFPDPGIMLSTLLPGSHLPLRQFAKTQFWHDPADGLINGAHIAVIPEFSALNPLNKSPILSGLLLPDCKTFSFDAPQSDRTHYYAYQNTVRVCDHR